MATEQGKERAPQIPLALQFAIVRLANLVQTGVAKGTKLTEKFISVPVDSPIPQAQGGPWFLQMFNGVMAKACDAKGKDYGKFSAILTGNGDDTPRTIGAKLNSLRNRYLAKFARIPVELLPDVKRDALGNVLRSALYVVEGEGESAKRVINPLVAGKVEQAEWPTLQGVPQVTGRTSSDDDLLSDDDDDYDF